MPSSKNYKRDYKQENKYKAQPEQIAARVQRNAARREMMKKGKVHKGDGMHVDHTKPISKGGTNAPSNLRVVDASSNSSFRRNSEGGIVSQESQRERKRRRA